MRLKKIIFFICIFLGIFFIKNISFGFTLNVTDYTELENFSGITPLTLQTTTNSYLITLSTDLHTIKVVEAYNPDEYLVVTCGNSVSNETTNRIDGYSVSSSSLSSVVYYTTTLSDGVWSSWTTAFAEDLSEVAPGQSSYVYVDKSNIAIYCSGLGILGTEVISSGVPLPNNLKFTDNIIIHKNGNSIYLGHASNINSYFRDINAVYCENASGSRITFDIYNYDSSAKEFVFSVNSNCIGGYPNILYNYQNFHSKVDNTTALNGVFDFFQFYYDYKNFPYIANTAEDLAEGTSNVLVLPRRF